MPKLHRKTRTGCTQCKRRRVKCDEQKPSCANCNRNHLQCSLEFLTPLSSLSRGKSTTSHSQTMPKASYGGLQPSYPRLSPELSASSFDTQTEELLHHYVAFVSVSLAGYRRLSVWRISIPQMGLAYPFLLSGIIAISALHLATLLPYRKHALQNLAVAQESAALLSLRASMNNPNAIHAIFAFAGSVVYYIMASPEGLNAGADRCRIPNKDDNHPHWFQMMRGLMALLRNHWHELVQGPFAPLLDGDPGPSCVSGNPDDEYLAKLEGMLFSFSSLYLLPLNSTHTPDSRSSPACLLSEDERKVDICKEALKELRKASEFVHSHNRTLCDKTALHMWPGSITRGFVELIYDRDPRALVILAHYCVLLKKNNHIWCLRGIGSGLLENIWQTLGEEWRPLIQWPMEQVIS